MLSFWNIFSLVMWTAVFVTSIVGISKKDAGLFSFLVILVTVFGLSSAIYQILTKLGVAA